MFSIKRTYINRFRLVWFTNVFKPHYINPTVEMVSKVNIGFINQTKKNEQTEEKTEMSIPL